MFKLRCGFLVLLVSSLVGPREALAQIDPERRELIELGYNQPLQGAPPPFSAYAFFYDNIPHFIQTNLTLRLAVAPTYMDSELGISHALGEHTDVGIGLAGGGFADSYYEIEQGKYLRQQSFDGYGGTASASIYHLFDPDQRIPLNGVLRGAVHYAAYAPNDDTAPNFAAPQNVTSFQVRTGLRLGGMPPLLVPEVAMELSVWYQGEFRLNPGDYGFASNPYHMNSVSHLFWARALFAYTLPTLKHTFLLSVTAGDSAGADRFSAYRIGGTLPLASEFPLAIPGYYYQELTATRFALVNANYAVPLDAQKRWAVTATGSTAIMQYLPGLQQPGHWNSGVGGGIEYHSHSDAWRIRLDCGYGFDAIRSHGRGAESIGFALQINLERTKNQSYPSIDNGLLRGLQGFFHSFD